MNEKKHVAHISSSCSCRAGVFLSESTISAALAKRVSELHSGTFQSDRSLDIIPVSWVVGRSFGGGAVSKKPASSDHPSVSVFASFFSSHLWPLTFICFPLDRRATGRGLGNHEPALLRHNIHRRKCHSNQLSESVTYLENQQWFWEDEPLASTHRSCSRSCFSVLFSFSRKVCQEMGLHAAFQKHTVSYKFITVFVFCFFPPASVIMNWRQGEMWDKVNHIKRPDGRRQINYCVNMQEAQITTDSSI